MSPITRQATSTSLLESLKDSKNDAVWREFDARYRPILCAFARNMGLKPADAEEIAQKTLTEFVKAYQEGRYDRSKGRLSSWIISIARNHIAMMWRSNGRSKEKCGESALVVLRNRTRLTQIWTVERERFIFARAWETLHTTGRMSEKSLKAFELVAMHGTPPAAAAAVCGMTLEEVYIAKTRVTKRLREMVEELTAAYGEDS